jgi:hypothetical protein
VGDEASGVFEVTAPTVKTETDVFMAWHCPECDRPTTFRVLHGHARYIEDAGIAEEYRYAVCTECAGPVVLEREDYGEGFENAAFTREYPPQARTLSYGYPIPPAVRNAYEEAVRCEGVKAWTAVAVMSGRALEGMCLDFDDSSKGIYDGLSRMLASGAISQELYNWGEGLREVRNEGAHAATTRVSPNDARHALDFLQALQEIIYGLRPRFEAWKEQRDRAVAARNAKMRPTTPSTAVAAAPAAAQARPSSVPIERS